MAKYTGSITTTGKSEAIRFEKGLFRQNPEFRQQAKVEAHVIGPGQLLVSIVDDAQKGAAEDPIVMAFLAFLARDMKDHPDRLIPVSESAIEHALRLTKDVVVSDHDVIADDVTL